MGSASSSAAGPDDLRHREEIRELYAHYCFTVDHGRADLFAASFTVDGVLWLSDRGSFRGRDEIGAHVGKRSGKTLHLIHNVSIGPIEGLRATAHAYFQLLDPATAECVAYGTYDDTLRREGGAWLWHLKKVNYLYQSESYASAVVHRDDFGVELAGVPTYIEDYLQARS